MGAEMFSNTITSAVTNAANTGSPLKNQKISLGGHIVDASTISQLKEAIFCRLKEDETTKKGWNFCRQGKGPQLKQFLHSNPIYTSTFMQAAIYSQNLDALKVLFEADVSFHSTYDLQLPQEVSDIRIPSTGLGLSFRGIKKSSPQSTEIDQVMRFTPLQIALTIFFSDKSLPSFNIVEYCCLRGHDFLSLRTLKVIMPYNHPLCIIFGVPLSAGHCPMIVES